MSKQFATISNDELLEKVGDARHDDLLKEFGYNEDTYIAAETRGLDWEVQTDREGNVIAVLGPVDPNNQ